MLHLAKTRHRYGEIDGLRVHYCESSVPSQTAVLLLHGYPSSSYSFRDVLPVVGEHAYVIAQDLPGFGFSDTPPEAELDYTFEQLSHVVGGMLARLGVERYVLYVTDWGTPVWVRPGVAAPGTRAGSRGAERERARRGPARGVGRTPQVLADPSEENRAALGEWMHFEGTSDEYLAGLPDRLRELQPPESWHLDWERMSREGNVEAKF